MAIGMVLLFALLAWQPDTAMLAPLYQEAFERKKQEYGVSDARTIQAARDWGLFLSKNNSAAGAQKVFAELIRLDETAIGANAKETLADVAALAYVSPPRQAEPLWQRAAKSPDPKVAARAFGALGQLRETSGDQAGAARFYRQSLASQESVLQLATTPEEKARLAIQHSSVAQILGQLVDPNEGIAVLRRSLAFSRSALGSRHAETATLEANLAGVLLDANAVDESVRLISEAIPVLEETMGEDHPRVAISSTILAFGLRAKGDFKGAEQNYRRALAVDERAYGKNHAQTLGDVRNLAEFLRERGRIPEAAALEKRLPTGAK